jgi:hypothetical protein
MIAIAGLVTTLAASIVPSLISNRSERETWPRDQRVAVYADALACIEVAYQLVEAVTQQAKTDGPDSRTRRRLVEVRDAVQQERDSEQEERDPHQRQSGQQRRNTAHRGRDRAQQERDPNLCRSISRNASPSSRVALIVSTRPRCASLLTCGRACVSLAVVIDEQMVRLRL